MRVPFLTFGILLLFLGACSSKKEGAVHGPPPLNKDLLRGKWKRETTAVFRTQSEFGDDGIVKITVQNMKEPIKAKYGWSGDRMVDVIFPKEEEVRKAYEAAAKAYKDDIKEKLESKKLTDRAGPGMLAAVDDTMPEKETYRVGISDPNFLVLTLENFNDMKFVREK